MVEIHMSSYIGENRYILAITSPNLDIAMDYDTGGADTIKINISEETFNDLKNHPLVKNEDSVENELKACYERLQEAKDLQNSTEHAIDRHRVIIKHSNREKDNLAYKLSEIEIEIDQHKVFLEEEIEKLKNHIEAIQREEQAIKFLKETFKK